jgi:acetyltransferase-like isoleucine patch superfamily enzyme
MKVGMLSGIRHILAGYSLKQLAVRFAEEYFWWLIRSLPGFEGVFLRYLFLKCTTKHLDGFCWISQGCTIANSFNFSIGKKFATNKNVHLDGIGGLEIGDNTGIGPNTVIICQEHSMLAPDHYFGLRACKQKPIRIGSDVWIGSNCFLKAGITIGDRAVVAACSNVITDVPANARVIGVPARPYAQVMREFLQSSGPADRSEAPRGATHTNNASR